MSFFNFNVIALGLVAGFVAYGILLGENRVRLVVLGSSLALFAASQVPLESLEEISQKGLLGFYPAGAQSILILTALITGLFAVGAMLGIKKAQNKVRSFILSIIAALFLICFSVAVLPDANRAKLVTDYNLAAMAYSIRYYVLLALIVWSLITLFVAEKDDKHKK
ncbi:hypothetical protein HYX70_04480 [Candidatus Saccharibacteria bacterium]|nr:hypothetical protein [Candidatus Saccharibacteria bacterium]